MLLLSSQIDAIILITMENKHLHLCIMAPVSVAFALGILASAYVSFVICIIVMSIGLIIALAYARGNQRSVIITTAVLFALGAARYSEMRIIPKDDISRFVKHTTAIEGMVVSDPEVRTGQIRVIIKVQKAIINKRWASASGSVYTNIYTSDLDEDVRLEYGDIVRINRVPYIPFEPTNPGQFSWKDYLARQGIYACATIKKTSDIEFVPGREGNFAVKTALWVKRHLEWSISQTHPPVQAGLITGMVLGTYSYLQPDTFRNFSRTGTLHLLAASGANCYILLFIMTPILSLIKVMPKWRHLVTIALIILYLLMVGPKPSLMRAAIMTSLMLLALPLGRVANPKNLFFTALFIVLLIDPNNIFDVGFQLSFLAVWALIWIAPVIEEILRRSGIISDGQPKRVRWTTRLGKHILGILSSALVCTTAVSLVTAPITAYYFNYFSLVSLPANIALALGVPFIFADGLVSLVSVYMGKLGIYLGFLGTMVTNAMLATVNYFGSLKWAAVSVRSPNAGIMVGYYLVLYSLINYTRSSFARK